MYETIKAVIFDFNGTLFNDTDFHNRAWEQFTIRHGKSLKPTDYDDHIHGRTNSEIIQFIFDDSIETSLINEFSEEKESIYRNICKENPEKVVLTPGASLFLDRLKASRLPCTIATGSYKRNVELYFKLFNLSQWFDLSAVIYDSGAYRGKPHPDMFLAASQKLQIPIEQCMIIEDSPGGLQAAFNAGAGKIVAVNFNGESRKLAGFSYIDQIISDFREIDY